MRRSSRREAGVALAALRVEDPERRPPPRRAVAVARDQRLGALADDVASEADPRPAGELEPEAGRLGDRGREAAGEPGRIEDQEQGLRAPGERGESMEPVGDPGRLVGLRPVGRRAGRGRAGRPSGRPAALPAIERPSSRLAGVMTTSHSSRMPRATASTGSKLRDRSSQATTEPCAWASAATPEREGRPAAGAVAADRDAGRLREAAGAEDRVERGEAGVDDAVVVGARARVGRGVLVRCRSGRRGASGQGPDDPRSCGTPASLEARDSGIHIPRGVDIGRARLEHLF